MLLQVLTDCYQSGLRGSCLNNTVASAMVKGIRCRGKHTHTLFETDTTVIRSIHYVRDYVHILM